MDSPAGGSLAFHGGGTTASVAEGATATRVSRTAVPRSVNSHAGTVASPRVVPMWTVVKVAPVTVGTLHDPQSGPADPVRSASACPAETTATFNVAPVVHRTSPESGAL